jgi:hypothetical protein
MKSILEAPIQVFSSAQANTAAYTTTVLDALNYIRTNPRALDIRKIYEQQGKSDQYREAKKSLPAATWYGEFHPTRKDTNVVSRSGVSYFDVDDTDVTRDEIIQCPEVLACWKSVSGAGYGFLAKVEGNFKDAFDKLYAIFSDRGITLDSSCSNVGRLNFLSYDPELWVREDWENAPTTVGEDQPANITPGRLLSKKGEWVDVEDIEPGTYSASLEDVIERCIAFANDRAGEYVVGNRHNHIVYLSSILVRYGVPLSEVWKGIDDLIPNHSDEVWELSEINRCYSDWAAQFGTWSSSVANYEDFWLPVIFKTFRPEGAIVLNQQYTSDYAVENHSKLAILAAKGTGKTTLINRWLDPFINPKAEFVITNRQSIVDKLVNDLNFVDYRNVRGGDFRRGGRYVICINSIPHIPAAMRSECVIIIDEAESTLNDLANASTFTHNRNQVRIALEEMISTCIGLLLLDADLSEVIYNYIKELTDNVEVLVNEYTPLATKGKDGSMVPLEIRNSRSMEAVLADIENTIKGKTPFLYCDKASTVMELGMKFTNFDTITSETKHDYPEIFNNPMEYRPQGVIGSPSVATAISLENNHFDIVGLIYEKKHTTIELLAQAGHRVRTGCDRVVWNLASTNPSLLKTEDECLAEIMAKHQKALDLDDIPQTAVPTAFDRMKAGMMAKNSRQAAYPLQAMIDKFRAEGYFVTVTELVDDVMDEEDNEYKQIKELVKVTRLQSIVNAEDVDLEELQEKERLNSSESASYTKSLIKRSLVLDEITAEDIKFYQKDSNWKAIRMVEYLNNPEAAEQQDEWQKDYYAPDKDFCADAVRLACDLNLDYFRDNVESITPDDIKELIEAAKEHSADIKILFGIDITKLKMENAIARKILAHVGLKLITKPTHVDGVNVRIAEVHLDTYFEGVIQRRSDKRTEVNLVL